MHRAALENELWKVLNSKKKKKKKDKTPWKTDRADICSKKEKKWQVHALNLK